MKALLADRIALLKFNVRHSRMSPVLPFDVLALIIDIVGENKDINLLKELALVSHSSLQICRRHLFTTVELRDGDPRLDVASSKRGFVKLLKSRLEIVNYIRKLTYQVSFKNDDDHLLSPILSKFLPTFSHLNCLTIATSCRDWSALDSSLTSMFLHLMRLPTINHINLSGFVNFPLSSLTLSVNLLRLDIFCLSHFEYSDEQGFLKNAQSETIPKIREFHTSSSSLLTTKLLDAKRQDGQPAFNFMDLRRLSMSFIQFEDIWNIRYLLQNAESLEKLQLSVSHTQSLAGILSTSSPTLKVLDLTVSLYDYPWQSLPVAGLFEELEAMAGHNMLESLSLGVNVNLHVDVYETVNFIGSIFQNVKKVLVKPGWSSLRQVSFKFPLPHWVQRDAELCKTVQSLPDKYLNHLPKLERIAFDYLAYFD